MNACQAAVAHFAWFDARCWEPAVGVVSLDGETYPACAEHGGAA